MGSRRLSGHVFRLNTKRTGTKRKRKNRLQHELIIKKLGAYKRELVIGILLSLTLALSSIALLTLSGWFISAAAFAGLTVITAANFNYFIPAALIRFLAFIRILSRYGDRVINHDYTFKILGELRLWFYQQLMPLAPAHLLSHRSGDLLNRIVNDIDTLDHLYLNILSPVLIAISLLIGITLFIAHFTLLLALITLVVLFFALLFISVITLKKSQVLGKQIQESTALLRTRTIDFLQGFVDLLLFVKKEKRLCAILESHDQLMEAQKKSSVLKGFTTSMMQLSSGYCVFLILFIGIPLVQHKIINGAELAMIIFLIVATFEQLLSLPFAFLSLGKTHTAAKRLLEIAHEKPAVIFPEKAELNNNIDYNIEFKSVCFSYTNRTLPVLNNFNLSIPAGTHLGI
ncbi:MAG: ABC transporter transmembrane domain-containing protein, partial [Gammaproteobacteria bacterium]|nr:ABC transporter transmembrane domain-containing protein [Gammaproteobacteria bacterium]